MTQLPRTALCAVLLSTGLVSQAALEQMNQTERPPLLRSLATVPMELGDWVGSDQPVHPDIVARSQTTDYLSRIYESRKQPGLKFQLWVNYSRQGTNLRHTPEICLPSGGWTKIESQSRVLSVGSPKGAAPMPITRLGYTQGELVEHVGFWYYIFGEGTLENYVRRLPITSRSSHGRTTRGSSMTVEVFYPGDQDPEGDGLREFARELIFALEDILPASRATYYVP
jgi:EpsI family protein